MSQAELAEVALVWSDELARALRERSAWGYLGNVEVMMHRGTSTLGGFIDRRVVPVTPGKSFTETLEAWRRSAEGRVVDRALVQANTMLASRLRQPSREAALAEAWLDEIDRGGPVVVLGIASDLVVVARATRAHASRLRVHLCPMEGKEGLVSAVVGEAASCTMVAMVSASQGPDGIHLITVLDVKTKGVGRLDRIDIRI